MFEEHLSKKFQVPQRPVNIKRVVAISDMHSYQNRVKIPKCDLLIVAGDITNRGEYDQIIDFNNWCAHLLEDGQVQEIICIAGNHDLTAQRDRASWDALLSYPTYLEDEEITSQGLRIYGSPWTPSFFKEHWVFNSDRGAEIKAKWDKIPDGLDILITHGPAYGVLDDTPRKERVGCWDLREAILAKKPRVHICGHIHYGQGTAMLGSTLCINAAICTEQYKPTNPPIVFDL